jgi:hypothetical protein
MMDGCEEIRSFKERKRDQQHELDALGQLQVHLLSPLIDIALQKKLLHADIVGSDRDGRLAQ